MKSHLSIFAFVELLVCHPKYHWESQYEDMPPHLSILFLGIYPKE
jgi:hypothetical protein